MRKRVGTILPYLRKEEGVVDTCGNIRVPGKRNYESVISPEKVVKPVYNH